MSRLRKEPYRNASFKQTIVFTGREFMSAGLKNLAREILSPDEAKEIATEHGRRVANCKCQETQRMGLGLCKFCADEARRDSRFIDHALEMLDG